MTDRFLFALVVAAVIRLAQVLMGRIVGLILIVALALGALLVTDVSLQRIDKQVRDVAHAVTHAATRLTSKQ